MLESNRPETKYEASNRQEVAENMLYQLRTFKATDLVPIAEKKIRNLINCLELNKEMKLPLEFRVIIINQMVYFCSQKGIVDSDIVAQLLRCVYECCSNDFRDEDFAMTIWSCCRILTVIRMHRESVRGNELILDREQRGSKLYDHIGYYLKHARIKRLTFGGRRLTEILCDERAPFKLHIFRALRLDVNILLPLLQYGGSFIVRDNAFPGRVHNVIWMLMWKIVWDLKNHGQWDGGRSCLTVSPCSVQPSVKVMCHNFTILMRSVPNPYDTTFNASKDDRARRSDPAIPNISELRHFYDVLFPGMGFGYPKPPSLKHSCRCVIRNRLNENWQLPDGVSKIGLPNKICQYINLVEK